MARNLQTWSKQYEQSLVAGEGECEEMRLLIEWLNSRLPAQVSAHFPLPSPPLVHIPVNSELKWNSVTPAKE